MVQFLSINFFSWISSIFVGFFKSSCFFVSPCISAYVNNNNKCDPSGFNGMTVWKIKSPGCRSLNVPQCYIVVCFVPFALFFAQHWTCSCFLLYTFTWHWMKNIFFTKLSVTFFPMTHTWQRYYNESSIQVNTIFKCTHHLSAHHDQRWLKWL